uniref:Putative secreted protein n=1 Tax=Ixodes ricinus TaxID=34613 RepID=A0A6B0V0B1_IXORI
MVWLDLSWFTVILFLMFLARLAYRSVFRVSMKSRSHGDTHAIIRVRLFPPSESWSSLVSFESRYGTWEILPEASPSAEITFPRARSPQLMEMPSLARSPVAPVRLSRSDPARSTKWNLAVRVSNSLKVDASPSPPSSSSAPSSSGTVTTRCCLMCRVKMAWDREDWTFIAVLAVMRESAPDSRHLITCSAL